MQPVSGNKLKILVAPLDWGLGHTTRCIPIIYELLKSGVEVLLAGNDVQQALLQKEFPQCTFLQLQGYNISYSHWGRGFIWKIFQQAPSILKSVSKENKWLEDAIEEHSIDAVISDNRFGLYSKKVPCVFITHQLLIKNGMGDFAESVLQQFNYKRINHFSKCWIPDYEGVPNLAGELSHPEKMPEVPCEYIGPLTRIDNLHVAQAKEHVLIMLSGPEPQRTLFEEIILGQLKNFNATATVVRGKPADSSPSPEVEGVTVFNHLTKKELNEELCRAEYIVSRTGYSSVMDIANLAIKPILVPTPGQTEQEYLAEYLSRQKFCITSSQKDFNLVNLLEEAKSFHFQNPFRQKKYNLSEVVQKFVTELENKRATRSWE